MSVAEEPLKYPIGRFRRPESPTPEQVAAWIEEIATLPGELRAAVDGLTDAQLDTPYREGGWTVRQVVHHVADSHINAYCRVRIAATETEATIRPYDEKTWAELPDARTGPVYVSLALVEALHTRWAALARALTPKQLRSVYHHPEHAKPMVVDLTLAMYAWHGRHHVAHITGLRERMGW
jgi:hypothetical protein